jgi:hypothetical protein
MRWVSTAFVVVAACWTGGDPPAAETVARHPAPGPHVPARSLEVILKRTACFGMCPVYTVRIRGNGVVQWNGETNVARPGLRVAHVTPAELDELDRAIDAADFFELDDTGHAQAKPACIHDGNRTTCSFGASIVICSDTSHAIVVVRRGDQSHRVDDAQCSDQDTPLSRLETLIDRIAGTRELIGP